jgi:8-oxo-dGTP diphosphatase
VRADADVSYVWHEGPVPGGLAIEKVHGFLFCPDTARVLVQECDGRWSLPGGSPELADADFFAVLAREAMEESQVAVAEAAYLGYQEVHEPGRAPFAQVRMAGLIGGFGMRRPDPDGGRLLRRLMCPAEGVADVLGWGAIVSEQVALARRMAERLWRVRAGAPGSAGYAD